MKPRRKRRRSGPATVTFLGGGSLATALVEGLREARYRGRIVVHDRNPEKLRALRKRYGVQTEAGLGRAAAEADILLIAVRPRSVSEMLAALRGLAEQGSLRPGAHIVSLAAGVPLAVLRETMGREFPIARAMPSPMCTGGRGLTALVFPARTAKGERAAVWRVFERLGAVVEIAEEHMDSFTVCYSVSHGYHALDALAAAGERCGLLAELALTVAAHALADGVLAWRQMGRQSLPKLLAKASTPGGTAEATSSAMDRAGYRRSILAGFRAGIERARALRGGGPAAQRGGNNR